MKKIYLITKPISLLREKKGKVVEINDQLLIRNTIFNFIGQAVPLLVSAITIPFIIQGLGINRFGLLSLTWVILGYSSIFDLGLSRATTKFVAEALASGKKEQAACIVWTVVTVQAILGVAVTLILVVIAPILVESILKIPLEIVNEAKETFYLVAFYIPIALISVSFRGVLEAFQEFGFLNIVNIKTNTLISILPLIGLKFGMKLPGIVALILFARIGALIAFIALIYNIPNLKKYSISLSLLPRLFSYGRWVMVSNIIAPFFVYLDRFLIGSILTTHEVAYYSAPYETVTRLWIIPTSLTMSLFPAFSFLDGIKDRQKLYTFFTRSIKYVFLTLGPITLTTVFFAKEVLYVWLGDNFAKQSTGVLQILILGVLVNSIAYIPYTLFQGIGKPDLPAKFHLIELPIYIVISWLLINEFGIIGAATAWTLRVILDTILLFVATFRICKFSTQIFGNNNIKLDGLVIIFLSVVVYTVKIKFNPSLFIQVILFIPIFVIFIWFVWERVLDTSDREMIKLLLKRLV
jgi:O-antigen/teichoic acid export membrane protein